MEVSTSGDNVSLTGSIAAESSVSCECIVGIPTQSYQPVNTCDNFYAGKIEKSDKWPLFSTDPWLQDVVKGEFLDLVKVPHQRWRPQELNLTASEQESLDEALTTFETMGIVEQCEDSDDGFYSTVFPVKKPDNSSRVILNLKNLNKHVEHKHFKMDTIREAVRLLRKDCKMASVDFKHAYYSVTIARKFRKFFRFRWQGKHFQFTCLPQGYSDAPRIFTKLLKPIFAHFRQLGIIIQGYIDDSLLISYDGVSMSDEIHLVMRTFDELGLTIHTKKSVLNPVSEIEYLGFVLNSRNMTVALTIRKKQKIIDLAQSILRKESIAIRDLAQLIGNFVAAEPGVSHAPLRYKPLEIIRNRELSKSKGDFEASFTLSQSARTLIQWWIENIPNMVKDIDIPQISVRLETDASTSGWGAVYNDMSTNGHWDANEKENHINWLELKAAFLALQTFCSEMSDVHVLIRMDNTTAVACVNKMGSTKLKLMRLISDIFEWAIMRNITLSAAHIPGRLNVLADKESRVLNLDTEWMLNTQVFKDLCSRYGSPSCDMFASRLNCQMKDYVSYRPDPGAKHVNAFSLSWKDTYTYMFPPFSVVPRVLQKLHQECADALIILPLWPTQAWFPAALQMATSAPVVLPKLCLWLPQKPHLQHPLEPRLRLLAMVLSGNASKSKAFRRKLQSFSTKPGDQAPMPRMGLTTRSGTCFVVKDKLMYCHQL